MSIPDHGEFDPQLEANYTFDTIPLGSYISYRTKTGLMKQGRVMRKKQEIINVRNRALAKPGAKSRPFYVEKVRVSILVQVVGENGYFSSRVNLTQFANVRTVKA